MTPRLKIAYDKEIVGKLMSKLSLKNRHEVPKIIKIILNMGLGEDASDEGQNTPANRRHHFEIGVDEDDDERHRGRFCGICKLC